MHTFLARLRNLWRHESGVTARRSSLAFAPDAELNEIGEPLMLYCQPANDHLPDPESCLITGITPQMCLNAALSEFAARIEAELGRPGTIGVGWQHHPFSTMRSRHVLAQPHRPLRARVAKPVWPLGLLLDVVRMAHALRPEGIHWPRKTTVRPASTARVDPGQRHCARRRTRCFVRRAPPGPGAAGAPAQSRLFDFALGLHKRPGNGRTAPARHRADGAGFAYFRHFPPRARRLAVMAPWPATPPTRTKCWPGDLAYDPPSWPRCALNIRQRLFTRQAELPEGVMRLPLKKACA